MEKQMATTKFKIGAGTVTATAELILKKTICADGDNVSVNCCEMGLVRAKINGHPEQVGFSNFAKSVEQDGKVFVGSIGKIGLTKENMTIVKKMIAKLESHPAWIAKMDKIEKNRKEIEKMEMERVSHPGYCSKCGSYCYGDCEAN